MALMHVCRLEEQQRSEKRLREQNHERFNPRWFRMSGEVAATPWGELEVYEYTQSYPKHRANLEAVKESLITVNPDIKFNPWQYHPKDVSPPSVIRVF